MCMLVQPGTGGSWSSSWSSRGWQVLIWEGMGGEGRGGEGRGEHGRWDECMKRRTIWLCCMQYTLIAQFPVHYKTSFSSNNVHVRTHIRRPMNSLRHMQLPHFNWFFLWSALRSASFLACPIEEMTNQPMCQHSHNAGLTSLGYSPLCVASPSSETQAHE